MKRAIESEAKSEDMSASEFVRMLLASGLAHKNMAHTP
ncbi:MAG: hypothetical protein FWG78_03015 [Coriobacteriia bacterium]|nr:hypothetical protein [Coriobacteriia bacterium]